MNKAINKIKYIPLFIISILVIGIGLQASAQPLQVQGELDTQSQAFRGTAGYIETYGPGGVSDIIARVIFIALSILAIVFIILIIIAGYQWMTAGGNDEQISKAKKNISNAVIGLVIILSAYAVTWFIFTYLPMSAGSGSSGATGGSGG